MLVQLERAADLGQDRARQVRDGTAVIRIRGQPFDEQRKLIAREAADDRLLGNGAREPLGEHLEHAVARSVAKRVVDLLETIHVEVQQSHHLTAAQAARDRLLQQMVKLHPVRDLGQRVVPGQITDAPLGALSVGDVARDEDVALELRVGAFDARARERHRDRLAVACPDDRLAGFLRGLQQVEALALALIEHGDDAAAEDLFLAEGEQLAGRRVCDLDHAVRRGHEHGIGHAVEHAVQVVLVDRGLPQARAHALERLLQLPHHVVAQHLDGSCVITLSDALGALDERHDGALELVGGPPRERGAGQRHEQGQRCREQQRRAELPGARRSEPSGETHLPCRGGLLEHYSSLAECLGRRRPGDVLHHLAHRTARLLAQHSGCRRLGWPAPMEDSGSRAVGDRDGGDRLVVHERLQPPSHRGAVLYAKRARDRIGGMGGRAPGARTQLEGYTLARGALRHRTKTAAVGVVAPGEQHGDGSHREQYGREGGTRVLQFEADGSHVRLGSRVACRLSPYAYSGIDLTRRAAAKARRTTPGARGEDLR